MPTPEYDGVVTSDSVQSEDDRRLFVQFYMSANKNERRSAEEGRPMFDEVAMVKIITPGSKDVMVNKASERYQERFPAQWERFKRRLEQVQEGTPLEEVPFLTVGQVAELKGVSCMTLEQLAGMSDTQAMKMMGMHGVRQKAVAYLEAAKSAAPITQLKELLEQSNAEIEALKQQVAALLAPRPKE